MFLKNAWYVAAWAAEIDGKPRRVVVLNEAICLFRDDAGTPIALEDACPHRKLALSMGRRLNDHIECGYHGLTFNAQGRCVKVPGQSKIPPKAQVHAYPVVERYALLWIWMGDPDQADPSTIFPVEHYGEPGWGVSRGPVIEVDCHYLHLTDNLLDPSHVVWVHRSTLAQAAAEDTPLQTQVTEQGVIVSRWMPNTEPAPFYRQLVPFAGNCDRLQHYEVRYPCLAMARAVFTPVGQGGGEAPYPPESFIMNSYNFFTPETETRTRFYWFQMRNAHPDDEQISAAMVQGFMDIFEEDRVILNAVQRGMDEATSAPLPLPIDGGAIRFRRALDALIAAEAE